RHSAEYGFAAATIELPGCGDRPRSAATEEARTDLYRAVEAGQPVDDEIVDRLVLPLVEKAVPERRAALDALLSLPQIRGPGGDAGNGFYARHRKGGRAVRPAADDRSGRLIEDRSRPSSMADLRGCFSNPRKPLGSPISAPGAGNSSVSNPFECLESG